MNHHLTITRWEYTPGHYTYRCVCSCGRYMSARCFGARIAEGRGIRHAKGKGAPKPPPATRAWEDIHA